MRFLITAGGTREAIDAVRYIGNRSSGRMGVALAEAAMAGGHDATLVVGEVSVALPPGVAVIEADSAERMLEVLSHELPRHDALIMAAAVADFRPTRPFPGKLRRAAGPVTLELEPTPDVLAAVSATKRDGQIIVAFNLSDEADPSVARRKLEAKRADLIVSNPLSTMDAQTISARLLYADGREETVDSRSKRQFADVLLERVVAMAQ